MNQLDEAAAGSDAVPAPTPAPRVAFERLRERGDELELLISGLLAFSLLTLPSRLFESWVGIEVHGEGLSGLLQSLLAIVGIGLGYALGLAFVAHLAIRGYWVGLIGLKAHFPDGVRWERMRLPGPVSKAFYRQMAGDLGATIDRVDRTASVLFSMTILCAIGIGWTGLFGLILMVPAAMFGRLFENSEKAVLVFYLAVAALALASAIAITPLDRRLARLEQAGRPAPRLQRLVHALLRLNAFFMLQRPNATMQFTVESNLPKGGFKSIFLIVPMLALLAGGLQLVNARVFSLFNPYQVITGEAVDHGMLSAHYESMRVADDTLQRVPMIPSDRVETGQLRLFIPHVPRRDVPLARQACAALAQGRNTAKGAAAARAATACMAKIWTAELDGAPIALDSFLPIERRDLGMRGLMGYLDLGDLPAGRHDLRLVWNPGGSDAGSDRRREYRIPFWYDPQRG